MSQSDWIRPLRKVSQRVNESVGQRLKHLVGSASGPAVPLRNRRNLWITGKATEFGRIRLDPTFETFEGNEWMTREPSRRGATDCADYTDTETAKRTHRKPGAAGEHGFSRTRKLRNEANSPLPCLSHPMGEGAARGRDGKLRNEPMRLARQLNVPTLRFKIPLKTKLRNEPIPEALNE